MKESDSEGLAIHTGRESCGAAREDSVDGGTYGVGIEPRKIFELRDADALHRSEGNTGYTAANREVHPDFARSETPGTYGNISYQDREIPCPPTGK
jgi:hypothetical protein